MKQTNREEAIKGYGKLVYRYMVWLGQQVGQDLAESPGSRDEQQHLVMHQQEHDKKVGAGVVSTAQCC